MIGVELSRGRDGGARERNAANPQLENENAKTVPRLCQDRGVMLGSAEERTFTKVAQLYKYNLVVS